MRYFPRRSFFKSLFVVPTAAAAIEAMPSQAMAKPPIARQLSIRSPKSPNFLLFDFDCPRHGVVKFEVALFDALRCLTPLEAGAEVYINISGTAHRAMVERVLLKMESNTATVTAVFPDPSKLNIPAHHNYNTMDDIIGD